MVDDTLAATLDSLDDAVNYMQWIVDLIRPHLRGPILEVGAGHGTFTASLARDADVHAVEPGSYAAGVLRERFRCDDRVTIFEGVTDQLPESCRFGSAVMINVLEHIEDDAGALREIHARLRPGGRLAVWVPAFELLYSESDRKLGHVRRYRRPGLDDLMRSAGFDVVESRYVNLVGWFSWLLVVKLMRVEPANGLAVRVFDRWVVPLIRFVESRLTVPFGQSILVVGRVR
jgi:SAM-dependent methyltransferase